MELPADPAVPVATAPKPRDGGAGADEIVALLIVYSLALAADDFAQLRRRATPYWQALIASAGQLAAGAVMIALITALSRKAPPARQAASIGG